jgi:type I restriction enzyme M protein
VATTAPSIVNKVWNYAHVLRDDGVRYRHVLEKLGRQPGMLGTIFRKAQNKVQDPAKLRRLISLMDGETWLEIDAEVKGDIYEGLKRLEEV